MKQHVFTLIGLEKHQINKKKKKTIRFDKQITTNVDIVLSIFCVAIYDFLSFSIKEKTVEWFRQFSPCSLCVPVRPHSANTEYIRTYERAVHTTVKRVTLQHSWAFITFVRSCERTFKVKPYTVCSVSFFVLL